MRSNDQAARRRPSPSSRRLLGLLLIVAIASAFFLLTGFPQLDLAREDVSIATAVDVARAGVPADQVSNCFQGFCFEDDVGFLQRWWEFASTYLRLVWPGLLLAVVIAAIADGFLFPGGRGPAFGTWKTAGIEARSATRGSSILPVGARSPSASATLVGAVNAPALAATVVLFSPQVWATRLGIAFVIGVALLIVTRRHTSSPSVPVVDPSYGESLQQSGTAALRFGVRLLPLFAAAAVLGGLGTQYFTEAGVDSVAGANVLGVTLAIAFGLLLDVPLMFGLPVAALALLIGADPIVVGILLVTLTVTGAGALRRQFRLGSRAKLIAAATVVATVAASVAGFGVASAVIAATGNPTIAWDGETCSYSGPARFGPQVHDFEVRNDTEDEGDGHTMAIVVGRLPDNVTADHLAVSVAADPTADLPDWFTVAGTREFVFPGMSENAEITLHDPGEYAVVCLDGGGFYVIFEFSMPQPMGWFDEFRSTFEGYVAESTFEVAG